MHVPERVKSKIEPWGVPTDPAGPDGGLEGTTVTMVLFLPLQPGYESEEVGPDLACIPPVITGARGIANKAGDTLTSREVVGKFYRLLCLWPM